MKDYLNGIIDKLDKHRLTSGFFQQDDVVGISRQLLGKILVSGAQDVYTAGVIVETEAYAGETDKASHAFGGRRTARTEIMYSNTSSSGSLSWPEYSGRNTEI